MDLSKEYINQVLTTASHNLRLTSEKIEIIAILKENITQHSNTYECITEMKKITELSKFAIKLGEVNNYINGDKIDFLKLSERFKEHSHGLVIELSSLLEKLNPDQLRELLERTNNTEVPEETLIEENKEVISEPEINVFDEDNIEQEEFEPLQKSASDILKESIIMEDLPEKIDSFDFQDFEDSILKPIKDIDLFLSKLVTFEFSEEEINKFIFITTKNAEASKEIGFEILSNMNDTIANTLNLIKFERLHPDENIIECLRACLIVIVAVVRGKDVDITSYLNRAERFGKEIIEKV